ncbi:MAG: DUF6796 family protein [Anaerolineales bacterium]
MRNEKMDFERKLRLASLVAALAGLFGAVGDLLLLYTPGFSADLFVVRHLPPLRITAGTLLAIAVIPFMVLGYWALSRCLTGVSRGFSNAIFIGGIYGVGLGAAIHGTVGTLVQIIQRNSVTIQDTAFISAYAPIVVPLYALFYLLMTVGTLVLAVVIWRGKSRFPRWFILLLPLWSNVLILPLGQLAPSLGDLLYPSIANLSHALMFGVMTWHFWGAQHSNASYHP